MLSYNAKCFSKCDLFSCVLFIKVDFRFCNKLKFSEHVITGSILVIVGSSPIHVLHVLCLSSQQILFGLSVIEPLS